MKILSVTLFFGILVAAVNAFGSPPRGDDVLIDGTLVSGHGFRLSETLLKSALVEREKLIEANKYGYTRTNPDGIVVDLKLLEGKLYVTAISISSGDGGYAIRPGKHPTTIVKEPILADWFSGKISSYSGDILEQRVNRYFFQNGVLIKTEGAIYKENGEGSHSGSIKQQ